MVNDIDINLKLRSEILDATLILENLVNELILVLLLIENPKKKAISNKSGSLSFKNKIDLLFDLDILASKEHQNFLLLMEFRNQFLHNIECNSFKKAVKLLGNEKEKRLLRFGEEDKMSDREYQYKNSFDNLKIECLNILKAKFEDRKNQIEDHRKLYANLNEAQIFFINKYFDILTKILVICENNASEKPDVINLLNYIVKTISDDAELIQTSKEYIKLRCEFKELQTPEKIKALLKK